MKSTQLHLAFQQEKPWQNKAFPDWKKSNLRPHHRGDAPYKPSAIRRIILANLDSDSWISFSDLCDLCYEQAGQHTYQVRHVLDYLTRKARIESTALYFSVAVGTSLDMQADRTAHPGHGKNYLGFEHGYRLKQPLQKIS